MGKGNRWRVWLLASQVVVCISKTCFHGKDMDFTGDDELARGREETWDHRAMLGFLSLRIACMCI